MKCLNCNQEFDGNFCNNCGTAAKTETHTNEPKPNQPRPTAVIDLSTTPKPPETHGWQFLFAELQKPKMKQQISIKLIGLFPTKFHGLGQMVNRYLKFPLIM